MKKKRRFSQFCFNLGVFYFLKCVKIDILFRLLPFFSNLINSTLYVCPFCHSLIKVRPYGLCTSCFGMGVH